MTDAKLAYSVAEAAAATGVSQRTIQRACKATDAQAAGIPLLPSKWVGNRRLITAKELDRWVDQLKDA